MSNTQLHDAEFDAAWRWRQMDYLLAHGAGEQALTIKQRLLEQAVRDVEVARKAMEDVRGTDTRAAA